MDYDLATSSAAWQYQPEADTTEDIDRPHTANAPRRSGRSSKKAVGAGRSSLARPGTSTARLGGERGGVGRPGASGSRILFKRTGRGRGAGTGSRSSAGSKKKMKKKKANIGFHDTEALQEQLRASKLQVQHWRAACRKQTTKCNSLEAELRRTDRKLEATVARRGGDAGLNNAQMRSEVRRLRDYVHDLQVMRQQRQQTGASR